MAGSRCEENQGWLLKSMVIIKWHYALSLYSFYINNESVVSLLIFRSSEAISWIICRFCFFWWFQGPTKGRDFVNSTMVGVGITMEGINQNDMIYEFVLENSWRKGPRNLTQWFVDLLLLFIWLRPRQSAVAVLRSTDVTSFMQSMLLNDNCSVFSRTY